MKTKHGLFFGFAVLALTAMVALAGCGDNGDPSSPPSGGATYTVNFDPGDGDGPAPPAQTAASGTSINLPGKGSMTAPSGKTFNGWRADGKNYEAGDSYTVTGYVTFIAQWSSGGGETAPNTPTGVTATAQSSSSISVSWSSVTGATSYDVYYASDPSSTKNFATNVSGTSYTHTGLQASTTYYYYIKAKNSAGESDYSSLSSSASATTSSSSGNEGGTSAPSTPANVRATAQSSTSIQISWNAVPGATSYKIYSPNDPGVNSGFVLIDTVTTTSYTDNHPLAGETWYYRVSAVNSAGESAQSASVYAKTPGSSGGTKPNAPTGLDAWATSSSAIRITWNAVTGATSYKIYRTTGPGGSKILDGTSTTASYTSTGWPSSTGSFFLVTAVNSAGESNDSDPVYATTWQ
jgi:fibronectin type 3 domain-containing protein